MHRLGLEFYLAVIACCIHAASTPLRADTPAATAAGTYTNPVAQGLPDPFVLKSGDRYFAYGTNAPGDGYRVLVSSDLVHWSDHGYALQKIATSWARDNFWAPAVMERRGKFYMFYSAMGPVAGGRQSHRICVAVADSPLGPFVDLKAPLLDIGKAVIDAHAFADNDGKVYLYYALDRSENNDQSHIYVVALSDDLTQVVGEPVFCTRPDADWEGTEWNEAPFVFRHGDTYVLMYSARGFFDPAYALGYATSKSPTGPWKKSPLNPVLKRTADVSGPGHNSAAQSPDGKELFCMYHIHRKITGGDERDLAIDRMTLTNGADGELVLKIDGPTRSPQPMPSGAKQ